MALKDWDHIDPVTGLDWDELCPPDYWRFCYKKGSSSAPAPPDPAATAAAQAAANKEAAIATAELNMVNQNTPYGTLEFEQRGTSEKGTPQYTATQTLAGPQQQMLDLTNQAGIRYGETANNQLSAVSDKLSAPLSFTDLGPSPQANEATRQNVRDAIMGRLQPDFDRDRARLDTQLANQGITAGSDAYNDAYRTFDNSVNDARLAADLQAGNEMSRMFGLESTARDRDINEIVMQRQIPLNETAALLTGAQVQGPRFITSPQNNIAPADILGATYASYNGQLNNFNQGVSQRNALTGGLAGLGAAGISAFSDRRLKTDINRIGRLPNGLGVYVYRYIWGGLPWIGVMADEVRKIIPSAVKRVGGYDIVDYRKVLA